MYKHRYNKYKKKYISLKRDMDKSIKNIDEYVFYKPKFEDQKNIFAKHNKEIIKIFSQYVVHEMGTEEKGDEKEFEENLHKRIEGYMNKFQTYFVKYGEKIIGFCFLIKKMEFIKSDVQLETFKVTVVDNDEEYIIKRAIKKDYVIMKNELYEKIMNNTLTCGPVIAGLCKNKKYKKVGSFLLKNIFENLKKEYDTVYLVPESIIHKNNLSSFVYLNNCIFKDIKLYIEDNKKLIDYYLSLGFKIDATLYDFEECISPYRIIHLPNFYSNAFTLYPVLSIRIK